MIRIQNTAPRIKLYHLEKEYTPATEKLVLDLASIIIFLYVWNITSPYLSSARSVAHMAALLFLHLSLSLAIALTSSQDFQPARVLSFSTVRLRKDLEKEYTPTTEKLPLDLASIIIFLYVWNIYIVLK